MPNHPLPLLSKLLYAHNFWRSYFSRSHAPRGNAAETLRVERGTPGTPSVHSVFPRGAWERAEKLRRWSQNLQIWQRRVSP